MVIAVSGSQNTGKSTFIKDFLKEFPCYKTHPLTYRDYLKNNNITVNRDTTKESQKLTIEWFRDTLSNYKRGHDNIILDRCAIDAYVYSVRSLLEDPNTDIDWEFIKYSADIVKQCLRNIDIVFYIPFDENQIKLVEDGFRDTNLVFVKEIDKLFSTIFNDKRYGNPLSDDNCLLFDPNDSPAIIDIFGSREQRISLTKEYVEQSTGGIVVKTQDEIFDPEQLKIIEDAIKFGKTMEKEVVDKQNKLLSSDE